MSDRGEGVAAPNQRQGQHQQNQQLNQQQIQQNQDPAGQQQTVVIKDHLNPKYIKVEVLTLKV